MIIVYIHQYFNTPAMAGGTRSYEMARRLVRFGHEVHMITTDRSTGDERDGRSRRRRQGWTRTEEAGIHVHWLPAPYANRMSYRDRLRSFLRFALTASPQAKRLRPDVVFATSTPLTVALPAVYAAKRNRVPMVFEVRDLWPELPIAVGALKNPVMIAAARWLERFAYRHSRRIVALSPGMKDGIVANGYPPENVSVIPNSCDFELFDIDPQAGREFRRRHEWLGDRPLVVYTGALGLLNGVDFLARVAAGVRDRDAEVRFLVVGTGQEEKKVRQTAADLGVLDRTFFMIPSLPKHDMPALLSAANIATSLFIDLKEMWANSANKFFDALAAGRPIAINYGGWHADLLTTSEAGLVLDVNDPVAAADRLVGALRDPQWLHRAGSAARQLGRDRFNRDDLATQLELVLREAISPGSTC